MKTVKEEMRKSYKRSDFTKLERGKFFAEAQRGTAVALLDPDIAKAFPSSKAVNDALHGLMVIAQRTARVSAAPRKERAKS